MKVARQRCSALHVALVVWMLLLVVMWGRQDTYGASSGHNPVRIHLSMELQTYYRRFHRQSVELLIPAVACVYGGVLLGKDLWLKGWIGYTMPISAGSVPVYRVRTWYGGLGVEKVVVRSRWFGISSRLGLVGRTGALWFNTNPIIDAVPIYYEGIPDNYRIDALGLGMAVNLYLTPFRSKGTGLVFSYGLNKYLLGIGAHRYAFNETFGVVQVFFTIGNARSVSNPD